MSVPIFEADAMILQGWINSENIIPPSGQPELRESVQRVLLQLDKQQAEIERLNYVVKELLDQKGRL